MRACSGFAEGSAAFCGHRRGDLRATLQYYGGAAVQFAGGAELPAGGHLRRCRSRLVLPIGSPLGDWLAIYVPGSGDFVSAGLVCAAELPAYLDKAMGRIPTGDCSEKPR